MDTLPAVMVSFCYGYWLIVVAGGGRTPTPVGAIKGQGPGYMCETVANTETTRNDGCVEKKKGCNCWWRSKAIDVMWGIYVFSQPFVALVMYRNLTPPVVGLVNMEDNHMSTVQTTEATSTRCVLWWVSRTEKRISLPVSHLSLSFVFVGITKCFWAFFCCKYNIGLGSNYIIRI